MAALHLLCESCFILWIVDFVRRFTGLEERMWICTECPPSTEALAQASKS